MTRGRWLTPDTPGDISIARCLSIPEHLQPAISGALGTLLDVRNWEQFGDMTPQECVDAISEFIDLYYESDCGMDQIYPTEHEWSNGTMRVVSGSSMSFVADANFPDNGYWQQGAGAIDDEAYTMKLMGVGTWKLDMWGRKANNSGILTFLVDDITITTLDLYNSTTLVNQLLTVGEFGISEDGDHKLSFKMASKNASSSGYRRTMTFLHLYRTDL